MTLVSWGGGGMLTCGRLFVMRFVSNFGCWCLLRYFKDCAILNYLDLY